MSYIKYCQYKNRKDLLQDIAKEVIRDISESDYKESDKLQVSIHRVVDNFVSFINLIDLRLYLNWFDYGEFETLDTGMLPDIKNGKEKFDRALLFCLVRQALYNIDKIKQMEESKK